MNIYISKLKYFLPLFILTLFFLPNISLGQNESATSTRNLKNAFGGESVSQNLADEIGYKTDGKDANQVNNIIGTIITAVLSVLGVLFVILTILAGYRWMTASGNEEAVGKAKKALKQNVIGLIIVVSAWAFWGIILNIISEF